MLCLEAYCFSVSMSMPHLIICKHTDLNINRKSTDDVVWEAFIWSLHHEIVCWISFIEDHQRLPISSTPCYTPLSPQTS